MKLPDMATLFFIQAYLTSGIPKASQVQVKSSFSSTCISPIEIVKTGLDWMLNMTEPVIDTYLEKKYFKVEYFL